MTRHDGSYSALFLLAVLAAACAGIGCRGANEEGRRPERPSIPAPPDVSAPPADATRTPSGIASKVLKPGTGTRHPRPNSEVTVHYTGWTTDGKMFDSSVIRQEPSTFSLDGVIPGWTEGVQMMVEGESRRFWIPAKLAYEGMPDRPQGTLVFDIELLKIGS
jgi:FKBP-type peptidyl-prolyl cis-trans isomerase